MKDIGSVFPLYEVDLQKEINKDHPLINNRTLISLAREGFSIVANIHTNLPKRVLIPAYTCQTVITPFIERGWTCEYYGITRDLRINIEHLIDLNKNFNPSVIVVHPYYGMDLTDNEIESIRALHNEGRVIIIDQTQCIFSNQNIDFADYILGSYRKWFPIADGGFISSNVHIQKNVVDSWCDNSIFNQYQVDAMYLRGLYFKNGDQRLKDISIRLNKLAVQSIETDIGIHKMSGLSMSIISNEDLDNNITRRYDNFRYLYQNVISHNKISLVYHNLPHKKFAPLYFPIYVNNRLELQKVLAENHIYAPILWSVDTEALLINSDIEYIYNHILVIPIDQRYDVKDMKRIAEIINQWNQ